MEATHDRLAAGLLDGIELLVCAVRPDGVVVGFNGACERQTGHPAARILGRPLWDALVAPEREGDARRRITGLLAARGRRQLELDWRTADGRVRTVAWSIDVVPGEDGGADLLVGCGHDVTESRANERALLDTERRYRAVVEGIRDVVFQAGEDGRLTFLNPAWSTLTGRPVEASIGTPLVDHVDPADRARTAAALVAAGPDPDATHAVVLRIARPDGGTRWVELRARRARAVGDELSGTLTDVTERKRAELKLAGLATELELANRGLAAHAREVEAFAALQRDFLASASHELRTPLTSIMGYLEIVLEAAPDEVSADQRRHLEVAYRGSRRLLALVEDLVAVNRMDSAGVAVQRAAVRVDAVIERAAERFAALCVRRGLALEVAAPAGLPAVHADPELLDRVVDHLMANAAKFTPAGGSVRLWAEGQGDAVVVHVTDTGVGIAEDELPRVFDRFYRASTSLALATPGTGLGLSLARALVEAHGGRLGATSTVGRGSTFSVTLPISSEEPAWPASSSSTTIPTS